MEQRKELRECKVTKEEKCRTIDQVVDCLSIGQDQSSRGNLNLPKWAIGKDLTLKCFSYLTFENC